MGSSLSCVDDKVPSLQRLAYDMTPIKAKPLPIIWIVGPPGSGRNTQGQLLAESLEFSNIKVADLIRQEKARDTDRSDVIKEAMYHGSTKVPDTIVIDLIKEEMLRQSRNCKGYLINNFPKNKKQASLFIQEIDNVDAIIYLISDMSLMIKRKRDKSEGKLEDESIRKSIINYTKDIKECLAKYGDKVEKIRSSENEDPNEVYTKIEAAIAARLITKTKITAESDYAQSQEPGEYREFMAFNNNNTN